jgi:hypothetical protein
MRYQATVYGGPLDGQTITSPVPELRLPMPATPRFEPADETWRHPGSTYHTTALYSIGPNPVTGRPAWLLKP